MQKLISKIDETRRLNDIDMPPFDISQLFANNSGVNQEILSWAMATNHSLALSMKELVLVDIKKIIDENNLTDFK